MDAMNKDGMEAKVMDTFSLIINPRRACAARVTVVVPCVCVCMFVFSFLPPCTCRHQNIGINGFTATQIKLF